MAYASRTTVLNSAFRNHVNDLVKQSKAGRLKAEQDRGSLLGDEFIRYYKAKGEDPWAHLPPVEVTIKILELRDLQTNTGTFFCTFLVMLDWTDESLSVYGEEPPHDCLIEHFHPKYEIFNVTEEPECKKKTYAAHESRSDSCLRAKPAQVIAAVLPMLDD